MSKISALDHRKFPRKQPTRDMLGLLVVGGKSYPTKIMDYCPRGMSLQVDENILDKARSQDFEIEFHWEQTPFSGRIRHTHESEGRMYAGVSLKNLEHLAEVSFTDEDPGWDLVEDAETLQNLFSDLAFKGPEVLAKMRQIQGFAEVFAKQVVGDELVLEVHELHRGSLQPGFCSLRFELFQTCHAFDSRVRRIEGGLAYVELPKKIARLLRRETVRVRNGTNGRSVTVSLESSVLGKSSIDLEVYDFSEHGIAILDPDLWLHVPPGVPVERIELTTNQGKRILGKGVIRGHRWVEEKGSYAAGILFETVGPADRNNWHNLILESRYPALSFDYSAPDHEKIWDLFERSGYLDLKTKEAFSHVMDVTRGTWEKLKNAGTGLSKRALIKIDDRIVGHLQMDRIYPQTWCVHHLAIDPALSKVVGKEIYATTTDVLMAEGANFVFSLTQASKPWNQRSYYDFVTQYRFPEHNELKTYQIYEADTATELRLENKAGVVIRPANEYDLRRIEGYYSISASPIERAACALTGDDLELKRFNQLYAAHGLSRQRKFIVGTVNGVMIGFARIETGESGVNIFGLLDMLYVDVFSGVNSESRAAYHEALLGAGLEEFKALGKRDVIVALDDDRSEFYVSKGLTFIWNGMRWIARRDILPRYHAYTQLLYGSLILRKDKIRARRKNVP